MPSLDPDRWRELSPYLDEALELSSDARSAWLASVAERDETLASDLHALLSEQDAADERGFLAGAVATPLHTGRTSTLEGQVVGAYRLVSLIGQGGMGSVWLWPWSGSVAGATPSARV